MSLLLGILMKGRVAALPRVALSQHTVTANCNNCTATADMRFHTDGGLDNRVNIGAWNSYPGEWLLTGIPADYDVRATTTAGFFTSGADGVWVAGDFGAIWTKNDTVTGSGFESVTFTMDIRDASTLVILITQTGMVLRARNRDLT
jgi:hypothetical protein